MITLKMLQFWPKLYNVVGRKLWSRMVHWIRVSVTNSVRISDTETKSYTSKSKRDLFVLQTLRVSLGTFLLFFGCCCREKACSNVVRQPTESLVVSYCKVSSTPARPCINLPTLAHNDTAHEDLNRSYTFQWHLALPRGLPHTQLMPQVLLAYGVGMINFVAQNAEGDLAQLFHCKKSIQFSFRFGEALMVFGVDQEYDARDLGKVVFP